MPILIAIGVPRRREAGAAGVALNLGREFVKLGHSVESWFLHDLLPEAVPQMAHVERNWPSGPTKIQ